MASTDLSWVDSAFPLPSQQKLNASVRAAIAKDPKSASLFTDIGAYIQSLRNDPNTAEPVVKKRKLDTPRDSPAPPAQSMATTVLKVEGISFSVPQRKKFNLVFTTAGVNAVTAAGDVEFGLLYDDIDYACCLSVPDKAMRQWNFCLLPVGADGLPGSTKDALVFTIPDGAPKTASGDAMGMGYDTTTYRTLLVDLFNAQLKPSKSKISAVEEPKVGVFFSTVVQSHRKGEKAFHIKAHRGNKEGYLFFLQRGILWAFKKPLMYFSFSDIDSVSYTSITKRTFNLSVRVQEDRGGGEFEFSMIDQEDYPGIDAYIKARKLNDSSMADTRRAKHFNVNGKADSDEVGDGSGMGELEKALYDAEDEEEEDYVPDADGDDDGSASGSDGSESDSDADENHEMESDGEQSVDLEDELGSEMEDVEPDEPKQKRNIKGSRS